MREIKFRAWDKSWNLMFGNDILLKSGRELVTFAKRHSDNPAIQNAYGGLLIPTDDKNMVFMQYTGLKDKNGTEIYEGDIVEISHPKVRGVQVEGTERGQILFDGEHGRFAWQEPGSSVLYGLITDDKANEVIGNIYENPELTFGADSDGTNSPRIKYYEYPGADYYALMAVEDFPGVDLEDKALQLYVNIVGGESVEDLKTDGVIAQEVTADYAKERYIQTIAPEIGELEALREFGDRKNDILLIDGSLC